MPRPSCRGAYTLGHCQIRQLLMTGGVTRGPVHAGMLMSKCQTVTDITKRNVKATNPAKDL